jgi:hypothetical protein
LGLLLVALAVLALGCGVPRPVTNPEDVLSLLPDSLAGLEMEYRTGTWEDVGGEEPSPILAEIRATGGNEDDLIVTSGFPEGAATFALHGWTVPGMDAAHLIDPVIANWHFDNPIWQATIAGRRVARAVPAGVDPVEGIYVYATGNTVFEVMTSDPQLAAQVLAGLP